MVQTQQDVHELSRSEILAQLAELGIQSLTVKRFSNAELLTLLHGLQEVIVTNKNIKIESRPNASGMPNLSPVDKMILKNLLASRGLISSIKLSAELNIPLSTILRRRKRLEAMFLEMHYALKLEKLGWRNATLYISTQNGLTSAIGKELLSWQAINAVCSIFDENGFDLKVEVAFRDNSSLLEIIERIKAVKGVGSVSWCEDVECIGINNNYDFILNPS